MCGIAGQFCFVGDPDQELVADMAKRIEHRGSDDKGQYTDKHVSLAHQRLSIIDLSSDAHQPMTNEDASILLVYNGEIYNYQTLREKLIGRGHTFKSHSDTEVILHGYEEWGVRLLLTMLDGMFAFVIWDKKNRTMVCARDRFGIKPFYYSLIDGSFFFASEIKALLAHQGIGTEPEDSTVNEFLKSGVLDHTHKTMFKGVMQIPPAHAMVVKCMKDHIVDEYTWDIHTYRYWDTNVSNIVSDASPDEIESTTFLSLLKSAVHTHLRSDVPVGSCLSGGLDSSTLVELIKESDANQKTFSAYFDDDRFDEREYIKVVVENTNIDAHYVHPVITPDEIQKLVYVQDEPFGSLSVYAQYCVMRSACGHVKVLLDGQGADEILAGYLGYQSTYIGELLRKRIFSTAISEMHGTLKLHSDFVKYAVSQLVERQNRAKLLQDQTPGINRYNGDLSTVLYNEMFKTNLPALLHYEDRNSMAFSIESRVPYLDTKLINFVNAMSYNQKIRNGMTKVVLRNAIKGLVPEKIRNRIDKMGFVTPEEILMKEDLKPFVISILTSDRFKSRKYWHATDVLDSYLSYCNGESEYSPELWRIICTELWLVRFFDTRKRLNTV
jgi:asparagine synthase (glutamine-hydrolysing)